MKESILVFVPGCLLIELHWNLKVCCLYFSPPKLGLSNWGCSLCTGATYTLTFTVYQSSKKFSWNEKQKFLLYKDTRSFWFVKPDTNMITLSLYKEILNVFSKIQTFSVVADTVMLCSI